MPPRGRPRGRGRGRGGQNAVGFLIQNAQRSAPAAAVKQEDDLRDQVEQEVAALLQRTGLHQTERKVVSGAIQESSVKVEEEVDNKILTTPRQQFPQPVEDLINQISQDVEWAAEVTAITTRQNAVKPQEALDRLKSIPVENWPRISTLWRQLWAKQSHRVDETGLCADVFSAFEADLSELKATLQRSLGSVDRKKFHLDNQEAYRAWVSDSEQPIASKSVCQQTEEGKVRKKRRIGDGEPQHDQWLINYLERHGRAMNAQTLEPFWNVVDPDDEIYTDSEEEENQTELRHAPFLRPLRRVIRRIRQLEELHTIGGRSLRVFNETQDMKEIVADNLKVMEEVLYSKEDLERRRKRQKWRQWIDAARCALWGTSCAAIPSVQLHRNCHSEPSEQLLKSLEFLQLVADSTQRPSLQLVGAFKRHFASLAFNSQTHLNHLHTCNPFQWRVPDSSCDRDSSGDYSQDRQMLKVKTGPPGVRFYMGALIECAVVAVETIFVFLFLSMHASLISVA